MPLNKIGFNELEEKIIAKNICSNCSACFITCPNERVLEQKEGKPFLIGECKNCGICLKVCPPYKSQLGEIENYVFGRRRKPDEFFGMYEKAYVTRCKSEEIIKKCQDGGVVTSLITSSLHSRIIDGAIVSGLDLEKPWFPKPVVITVDDVIDYSGTRYTFSPNLIALKEAISRGLKKIAFVGTPCQILAIRKIQMVPVKKYSNIILFTIGLFCSECFSYKGLMVEKINKNLGIKLEDIKKINIKGKLQIYKNDGNIVEVPLKEIKNYTMSKCRFCNDFSAELADISTGGVGLEGRTFTILRTKKGQEIFEDAINKGLFESHRAEEYKLSIDLIRKLTSLKRKNARFLQDHN